AGPSVSAGGVPLEEADRTILALEGPTVVGHTCKVVLVGPGAPAVPELRESIAARLDAAPALTRRLGGPGDAPEWVPDPGFDVSEHVVAAGDGAPVARSRLRDEVARLFAQHLDRDRPLWRIDVLALDDGATALVWRLHHALADGTASMRLARGMLWDAVPAGEPLPDQPHTAAAHSADEERRQAHLAAFLRREFARSAGRSPFDGHIGRRRQIAFASVSLKRLHDAGRALAGATLNDSVLAVVAGALRAWVQHHHGDLGGVRVRVPVSLHHEGDDAGNRDSFFTVALPLNEPDPVARLCAVHDATAVRKADHDAEEMDQLLQGLAGVSPRLSRFCERIEGSPRHFAVNVSNVPGPRTPVSVLGAPVESLHSVAEIGERHALRITAISLAGTLCFGFCADPDLVDDVQAMADGVEQGAAELDRLAGV
ncbi:MAG TPA: wax ester/triacylglycerol synthase domain-containing protein, partial [Thermoleophilaceae bacterium]|nr:wax ester/triacylglycerol synthase domain-containing protein [Thermoleophilaceae bacterium]